MRSATVNRSRVVAGRFALEERLGHGRFGEIYGALDMRASGEGAASARPDDRIALQIVHSSVGGNAELRDRFATGFARVRSWSHPNIVKLLELGRDGATLFVTMERLEGASMRDILNDLSPATIDPDECLAVIRQVGDALQHAHARGMVHGDLRPANVFVTHDYAVKLLDFAPIPVSPLAVLVDESAPNAPLAQTRDDIYGLACLAYELLSGRHPFGGSLLDEARQAGLEPLPIAGIPRQQWQALRRVLSPAADASPSTIDEFLDDFGITGTESLPIADGAQAEVDPFIGSRLPTAPSPMRYDDAAPLPARSRRASSWSPGKLAPGGNRGGGRRLVRPVLLVLIALTLGGVVREYYWPLREATTDLYARVIPVLLPSQAPSADATRTAGTASADGIETIPVEPSPIAPPVSIESAPIDVAPNADATSSLPSLADAGAVDRQRSSAAEARAAATAEPPATPVAPATAAETATQTAAATTEPPPNATQAAGAAAEEPADGTQPPPGRAEAASRDDSSATAMAAVASPMPAVAFVDAFVTVPEFGSAARVVIRRSGRTDEPLDFAWWTSDDTAIRDDDFADLDRPVESFGRGEATATIYVPIVDDIKPEPNERFFVHVELRPNGEPAARPIRAEVMIVDDDS